ncbi:MAG: hypothetical protein IJ622_11285 [Bacteroidales bacterium]|nr:hypothetical protein [Bacteroidales bacterium]
MKKVTVLAVLLSLMTFSAKAQWFDFSNNQTDLTFGVNLGAVGYHFDGQIDKTYADFGTGLSASVLGVYLDFIYQDPEHRWDRKVTEAEYDDHTALTINAGYKIPVLPWLNLIPLVGYSNETTGKTIGNSIGVDVESESIYHDYERETIANHFNYGLGLSVKPIKWLEIGGVCTSHAVYGNITLNLYQFKK